MPPLLRHALLRLPVIYIEPDLAELHWFGEQKPPVPEWGLMIAENLPYIERAPIAVMGPIVGLILLGSAINMMFDD